MHSYITMYGLWMANNELFSNFALPESVDSDAVIGSILIETMDLEVLYSDPVFCQMAIGVWSSKMLPIWEHLAATQNYEYNPIENYDRHEEFTDPVTVKTDTGQGTDTIEGYTSGFNSGNSAASTPNSKTLTKPGATYTSKIASALDGDMTRTGHIHGNIGVTTTQEMIKQEREIAEFSLESYIVEEFKSHFCLLVY